MLNWTTLAFVRHNFALYSAIAFFFLVTVSFLIWTQSRIHQYLYNDIDKQLLIVAESIRLILPEDYHERATTPDAITQEEYQKIEGKLSALADKSGAKYIWTDILLNGTVYLTSCNRTPGPERPDADIYYFMPYQDGVSTAEMQAFESAVPVYTTFSDIWGHFRAVFVPIQNSDGSAYLACAEFTVDYVDAILAKSNLFFIIGLAFFLVGIFPLCLLYIHRSHTNKQLLELKNSQLEQTKEHLTTILRSIGDGVIVTDSQGVIRNMNPAAEKLTGWDISDAAGKPEETILQFISTDDRLRVPSHVTEVLSSKKVFTSDRDISLLTGDNRTIEIIDTAAPIMKEGSEEISGVVLIIRDVTERNKIEAERRQNQKLQSLGQLTGGIAHDVNNMLAGISGAAELLEKSVADNPKAMKYLLLIQNASKRTADLIGKLLAFSRKGKVVTSRIDVHAIILDTVTLLERSIDKRITITTDLDAETHVVTADPSQLQNGLLNLFINARDAMPEGGKLHIATTNTVFDEQHCQADSGFTPNDYIRISIQDTGLGIPPEVQPHIFEPFYTTKKVGKGTGLGLASVYGMIQEHKGIIRFYSEPGTGTVFNIYLPVSAEHNQEVTLKTVTKQGHGTVLLVDDEDIIRQTGALLLEHMGYSVILARNGSEGVAMYKDRQEEIDFIILDMVMPVMNGKEAFEHIQRINPAAKIVITSGFAKNVDINAMLETGAVGYLMKPFSRLQLQKILNGSTDSSAEKNASSSEE